MKKTFIDVTSLRKKAEEMLSTRQGTYTLNKEGDVLRLVHELEVHQVELEMQNEELKESIDIAEAATQKFTMLYDFAPTGYFTLDRKGVIRELNLNGAKMLGMERESLISINFIKFVSPGSRDAFNEFFRKLVETDSKQTCEVTLATNNIVPIYVLFEGINTESTQNCLISAIDITERRRAEEALKENEERLQELNATKDKFFSIIAHDLRGPFTSIIGFSGLLLNQVQTKNYESIEKYATIIQKSSNRAMTLLVNLLEWARLQTGTIKFSPKKFEMLELINDVTELLQDAAQQKSITISKQLPARMGVFADKEMMSSVLRNLVSNAIKFTNTGGKIIISSIQKQDEITMIVSDNGVGIEKADIKKLFMIDKNQSKKGTQNEVGSGLGLILCKEFVTRNGGKIWVESEPAKGTSFYFTVPKVLEAQDQ